MDIDTSDNTKVIDINDIETQLTDYILQIFNFKLKLIFIQKSDKSQSYHVYGNFATTLTMMKYIVKGIKQPYEIDEKTGKPKKSNIDLKVYKRTT